MRRGAPLATPPGPGWEAVRDGIAADRGWPLYLDRYAALLTAEG